MGRPGSAKAAAAHSRSGRARDRGAAAVEMALVLPLIVFLVFGIIDFGRMFNAQITLTEAAREGARAVALGESADPRVATATQGLTAVTTTVTPCPSTPSPDADATVTVGYSFQFVTPLAGLSSLFGSAFSGPLAMSGRGVMPCLG